MKWALNNGNTDFGSFLLIFIAVNWHSSLEFIDIVLWAKIHVNQTSNPPGKIE